MPWRLLPAQRAAAQQSRRWLRRPWRTRGRRPLVGRGYRHLVDDVELWARARTTLPRRLRRRPRSRPATLLPPPVRPRLLIRRGRPTAGSRLSTPSADAGTAGTLGGHRQSCQPHPTHVWARAVRCESSRTGLGRLAQQLAGRDFVLGDRVLDPIRHAYARLAAGDPDGLPRGRSPPQTRARRADRCACDRPESQLHRGGQPTYRAQ